MSNCYTCDLVTRRNDGTAPLWDNIHRTAAWDVVHSYNTSLPGWLVLITKRHVVAIDGLTEAESAELGLLLRHLSIILKEIVGCTKTYVMQFAEAAEHPHVHFHLVPRMAEQPVERRGPKSIGYLGVPEDERLSESAMNEIAVQVRKKLIERLS